MNRILKNIARFPRRTWASIAFRMTRAHRLQARADAYVASHIDNQLVHRLDAVPGYTSLRECKLMFYLACISPNTGLIVEIGAYKGKSTAWLAEAARQTGRRLVSIDPHVGDSLETFTRTVEQFDITAVATIHRAFSHAISSDWTEPIATLWIDGAHDYKNVRQDIDDFTPHVAPGGYIIFDDATGETFPGVKRAIDETLRQNPDFEWIGLVRNHDVFRRRSKEAASR